MSNEAENPRRTYLQFSLQTLLILMLVLAGLLAWKVNRAKKQQAAVAWVCEIGGSVLYDYEVDENGTAYDNPQPPAPAWLIDQVGIDRSTNAMVSDSRGKPKRPCRHVAENHLLRWS